VIIDSSALLAIFLGEAERDQFLAAIIRASSRSISVANVLETTMVLESRKGEVAGKQLDLFIRDAGIQIIGVDVVQLELARSAFRLYGKGRHPAALNFGDCFAYALAKVLGEPLLAKGNDFLRTDIPLP
jgi:ribonuclease VapC